MCGLPTELRESAHKAMVAAQPVAARLISRKIACNLRIEMAAIRARSAHPDLTTTTAQWAEPADLFADIVPLLIANCTPPIFFVDDHGDGTAAELMYPITWPKRQLAHYRFAAALSRLNRAWNAEVKAWRYEACAVWLCAPTDAIVRGVAHASPNLVELQCHQAFLSGDGQLVDEILPLTNNSIAVLPLRCRKLQRLCLRMAFDISSNAIGRLMVECKQLRELDLVMCHIFEHMPIEYACNVNPNIRLYASKCGCGVGYDMQAHGMYQLVACAMQEDAVFRHRNSACTSCFVRLDGSLKYTTKLPRVCYGQAAWESEEVITALQEREQLLCLAAPIARLANLAFADADAVSLT